MLPPDELTKERYKQGTVLFTEGDAGDAAYIVHSGSVGIFKEIEDGRIQLAMLKDGELFGEMAIIDGSPRMAEAVTLEDSVIVKIPKDVLESKLTSHDPFLRALILILVNNLRNVHRAYMHRPRSVHDYLILFATHAEGLRTYLDQLEELDPEAEALKKLTALENAIRDIRHLFSGHEDRRRNVVTDSDL
ncbi:MAG: cyclic nucleotide-binding domain-containing protein [Rhodospirillales bacterium]|jgi:CRP-like cAMP-binding protein|nr:cyclic nucleotide-binding domain-containing protein [Rhodospirillales bacterium]